MRDMDAELAKEIEAYKSWKDKFGGFSRDMTLRDYFATAAMQAVMNDGRYGGILGVNDYAQQTAKHAYEMADAMLEARKT